MDTPKDGIGEAVGGNPADGMPKWDDAGGSTGTGTGGGAGRVVGRGGAADPDERRLDGAGGVAAFRSARSRPFGRGGGGENGDALPPGRSFSRASSRVAPNLPSRTRISTGIGPLPFGVEIASETRPFRPSSGAGSSQSRSASRAIVPFRTKTTRWPVTISRASMSECSPAIVT